MISIFIVYEKLQRSKWCNRRLITHRIPPAVSGPDGRIPPAPGTNQIAGFVEYRPFAHWEKKSGHFFWGLHGFREKQHLSLIKLRVWQCYELRADFRKTVIVVLRNCPIWEKFENTSKNLSLILRGLVAITFFITKRAKFS